MPHSMSPPGLMTADKYVRIKRDSSVFQVPEFLETKANTDKTMSIFFSSIDTGLSFYSVNVLIFAILNYREMNAKLKVSIF